MGLALHRVWEMLWGLWLPKRCSDAAVSPVQPFAAALPAVSCSEQRMRAKYAPYAAEFRDDGFDYIFELA